jgi:hypothetical protein
MRFVETTVFTRQVSALLGDDEYRRLQLALLLRPEAGAVIQGGGGLRKIRYRRAGAGKRGGIRVIYYWASRTETFFLLFAYAKNVQDDLTPSQLKILSKVVKEELP